jgi:hypothetical protein
MSVNVENINKVIELLRRLPPEKFDMGTWHCGTATCIGGHAQKLFGLDSSDSYIVGAELGLGERAVDALFFPHAQMPRNKVNWQKITRRQAVRVLKHLRDTGEVDWSKRGRR